MLAVQCQYVEVVELLLSAGAAVDAKTHSGETALRLVGYADSVKCARLLLDCGADVNLAGRNNCSALQSAVFKVIWS